MSAKREKVVVAMSGGVDSSVAACLLVEQGYDVMGLFMRVGPDRTVPTCVGMRERPTHSVQEPLPDGRGSDQKPADPGEEAGPAKATRQHQGCCSALDAGDARFVAGVLGIPFYALNFEKEFDALIDCFADEYVRGRTPNPCIVCNDRLKFGKLVDYADAVGATYIATGHYARITRRDGRTVLMRGRDAEKDQSYVLFGLGRTILDRTLFPVGELTKSEVRDIATRFSLPNREKPDSVEICFVPDRDYARVVRQRRPEAFIEGDVRDQTGRVIGRHKGIGQYTIGQRRGLGIAAGRPIYVTQLDVSSNTVTVGDGEVLLETILEANGVSLLADVPDGPFRAQVQIRYLHRAAPATVEMLGESRIRVTFDEPQRAVTPGQAVVFYDGDVVLGGAWIDGTE
ncbi:MAG: tRNA 2-thiouridine(34) synthase MnmA [Phycisphaerales bacterium]|nr:MAG: tRNA 2-thiouridine(34) synthase MnmA [Phycisphaerales bacterium]